MRPSDEAAGHENMCAPRRLTEDLAVSVIKCPASRIIELHQWSSKVASRIDYLPVFIGYTSRLHKF
jgi:hypothetical protein